MYSLIDTLFRPALSCGAKPSILARLNAAMAIHRSRARLARLDTHLLQDIGVDRETATHEASKPLWDAPATWKQ